MHPAHPAACDPVHPVNILKINRISRIASDRMCRMRDTYTEIKSSQKGIDNLAALGAAHRHSSSSLCEDVLTSNFYETRWPQKISVVRNFRTTAAYRF
jgi:hypothetical protein